MAKLQKSAAVLAASALLGFFFMSGTVVAAQALPSNVAIKTADPIGTFDSNDDDSDDDASEKTKKELKLEQRKLEKEAREQKSANQDGEKKRKELREKFGTKDSLGLPPIVIHPKDDREVDDGDDDDAATPIVKPRKKPTASPTTSPAALSNLTPESSVTTNTQSLKGGQLATGSAAIAGSSTKQSVNSTNPAETSTKNQSTKKQIDSSTKTVEQIAPIDVSAIDFTGTSPTDKFVEAAILSIGAMAVGAMSLGAVAIIRGKRQQKELKVEYQYSATE